MSAQTARERTPRLMVSEPEDRVAAGGEQPFDLETAIDLYFMALLSAHCSDHTLRAYRRTIGSFRDFLTWRRPFWRPPLSELNADNARAWLTARSEQGTPAGEPLKLATLAHAATILKAFGTWCWREGYVARDPLRNFTKPKAEQAVVQPFTADQIEAMLFAIVRRRWNNGPLLVARNLAVVYFMLDTGIRAAELVSLRRDQTDLRGRTATVTGKGNKTRPCYFDPTTATLLTRYLALRDDNKPWLFVAREGHQWSTSGLATMIGQLGKEAGITGVRVSPHTFRHTMAVNYLSRFPGQVFHLQLLLGHADSATTRRYAVRAEMDTRPALSVIETMGLDKSLRRLNRESAVVPRRTWGGRP